MPEETKECSSHSQATLSTTELEYHVTPSTFLCMRFYDKEKAAALTAGNIIS
jgi:hypothetical protein